MDSPSPSTPICGRMFTCSVSSSTSLLKRCCSSRTTHSRVRSSIFRVRKNTNKIRPTSTPTAIPTTYGHVRRGLDSGVKNAPQTPTLRMQVCELDALALRLEQLEMCGARRCRGGRDRHDGINIERRGRQTDFAAARLIAQLQGNVLCA